MAATKTVVAKDSKKSRIALKYANVLDVVLAGPEGNIVPASATFQIVKVK